ncbi:GNAT family N-acetyltransferase [Methylophilus sp. UBA6697]|jgi:cyclohexyl-isocyanide hydratase|uniref:GNAT family N-acetyltransferase n=1 Tax=Methylophilus sp. UBA6697 TaxID=1946902 RepID=UPI000EEFA311|nr:GNAT family N-acetyltransferase [Methylophilus sp. UBA6697]HCU84351.1 GNAT family N-acetyltransferase [Methylophilus sp.]
MEIRTLQESDKALYSELWRNALVEQDEFFRISIEDEPSPQIQTKFSIDSFTLGAFINTNLLGTVSVERDVRAKLEHKALLFRMFVHPSAAGKGVGKALVNEAISQARSIQGLRQLYLTVLDVNERAIHLYTSAGFETFAHEPESVKIKKKFIGELQMVYFVTTPDQSFKRDWLKPAP